MSQTPNNERKRGTTNPDLSRAVWRKSARSSQNGACVEVASLPGMIAVQDSKNPDGPKLTFTRQQWRGFIWETKAGAFEL